MVTNEKMFKLEFRKKKKEVRITANKKELHNNEILNLKQKMLDIGSHK